MQYLLIFILSSIEWIALLSFPLILLGYNYRTFLKRLIGIGLVMSMLGILLRLLPIPIFFILAIQILLVYYFVKRLLTLKHLESLVITSLGYGFYAIIQLLLVEIIIFLSKYSYLEVLFSNTFITNLLQIICAILALIICIFLQKVDFHLSELKGQLQGNKMNTKIKIAIYLVALLTFLFICIVTLVMTAEEQNYKSLLVILCITLLFCILSVYFVIQTQIKIKRLNEAKKFHLDKEQQLAHIVEGLRKDALEHYQVIFKLCQRGDPKLVLDYMEKHHLHKVSLQSEELEQLSEQLLDAKEVDELLYAFLKNKRKLAHLLGVELLVPLNIQAKIPISLSKIRCLSIVIDELILALYQAPIHVDKKINFFIETMDEEINFDIASNIELEEQDQTSLRLFEALLQIQKENVIVHSTMKPVRLSISCSIS